MVGNVRQWVGVTLRLLMAAVFVVSALAKLFAIDHFEIYIFSYGILPLNLCFLLARLCIGVELAVALFLLTGWYPRLTRTVTVMLLLAFTLFLCYAALAGRSDSCQCFGKMVEMSPWQSILKNAILLVLVLLSYRYGTTARLPRLWMPLTLTVVLFVLPFVISVPDNWAFGPSRENFNREAFSEALEFRRSDPQIVEPSEPYLLAFVTRGCPYCRMAREKLSTIASRHDIDSSRIVYVEPKDLPGDLFVQVTYGSRPLLLLLDSDSVLATYHFRNIDERQISDLLGEE